MAAMQKGALPRPLCCLSLSWWMATHHG